MQKKFIKQRKSNMTYEEVVEWLLAKATPVNVRWDSQRKH